MPKKTLAVDKETVAQMTEGEHLKNLVESVGWRIAYEKLSARILDLQNINNIDTTSIETMTVDLKARKMAAELIFNFLKLDVYGGVEQQKANESLLKDSDRDTGFVERH